MSIIRKLGPKKLRPGSYAYRLAQEQQAPAPAWKRPRWVVWAAFIVLVAAITKGPTRAPFSGEDIDASVIADNEFRAEFSLETVDLKATKEARDAASAKVPDYYRVDRDQIRTQLRRLRERIDRVKSQREAVASAVIAALRASTSAQTPEEIITKTVGAHVAKLKEDPAWADLPDADKLSLWLTPELQSLPVRQFTPLASGENPAEPPRPVTGLSPAEPQPLVFSYGDRLSELALENLEYVLNDGVRSQEVPAGANATQRIVILRDAPLPNQPVSTELAWSEAPDPAKAEERLRARLLETTKRAARDNRQPDEWAKLHDAALAMASPLIKDTIRLDSVYTVGVKERVAEDVPPVMKQIEAGEIMQDRGKRWTAQSRSDVKTYLAVLQNEERPGRRVASTVVAHIILVGLVLLCLSRSIGLLKGITPENSETQLNLALLLMCAMLVAGRLTSYFEPSGFVLPVAACGILFAILINVRLAAMVSLLTAVLVSAQYSYDWRLLVVGTAMSLAGVFSIFKVRRRSDMAAASLKATLVGLLAITAFSLAMDSLLSEAALRRLILIGLNGGICLLAVPGVLSPLERLFGITTDIQLLEYSDLNNQVMSQLAIRAPATYAHSLMLGQLAESAAEAIGANGLLARVCAYYHDMGKMLRSEYFTENQKGYNIHDQLSPRLSARAVASHVIQGAQMAREYHLPKPIVDGILEHHGTCKIGFFYQQAKEMEKHGDVREEDFRYPGPRPQRPETAILMICDAVESGVRSIKNPNEERVREFVDKIIAARSADRQFDDCDLTLKQLDTIAEVVTRRMMTGLHTRLAYPDVKPEMKTDNVIWISGGRES